MVGFSRSALQEEVVAGSRTEAWQFWSRLHRKMKVTLSNVRFNSAKDGLATLLVPDLRSFDFCSTIHKSSDVSA